MWIWLIGFILPVCWTRYSYGPSAMTLGAWIYVLSPNLIAHGALATMELPLVAGTLAIFWLFCRFLETNRQKWFWIASVVAGLTCSCKLWWYYYLVAIMVKVPVVVWVLACVQLAFLKTTQFEVQAKGYPLMIPLISFLYVGITMIGSSRNYGMRYLLPLAPLAIVWISALGERRIARSRQMSLLRYIALLAGLTGYIIAVAGSHPYELTYFNILAGGPERGRGILADSNLDWGQGLKALARLQHNRPNFSDITLYYFGNTEPIHYRVSGSSYVVNAVDDQLGLGSLNSVKTRYLAVSASLQRGPWGPPGFFHSLNHVKPVQLSDDMTIAIYCTADLWKTLHIATSTRHSAN
jgi:hypothetical protein